MKKVSHYKLTKKLGEGAYGQVYLGVDTRTREPRAIKAIETTMLNSRHLLQVQTEISVLMNIQHPSIVSFYDKLRTKSKVYIVMEHCGGGDLQNYITAHGPADETLCQKWLRQIVLGLSDLYFKQRTLHRDLKPGNILLTDASPSGDAKLADFGFARILTESGLAATRLGTPLYTAPEILHGQKYSFKADIWSLGVMGFTMLAGQVPFQASNLRSLAMSQSQPLFWPSGVSVSESAKKFIEAILVTDPNRRPNYTELLADPFLQDESLIDDYVDLSDPFCTELNKQISSIQALADLHQPMLERGNTLAALCLLYNAIESLELCSSAAQEYSQRTEQDCSAVLDRVRTSQTQLECIFQALNGTSTSEMTKPQLAALALSLSAECEFLLANEATEGSLRNAREFLMVIANLWPDSPKVFELAKAIQQAQGHLI